jgi:hypothetical protein
VGRRERCWRWEKRRGEEGESWRGGGMLVCRVVDELNLDILNSNVQ